MPSFQALQFDRQIVQDAFAGNPASELAGQFVFNTYTQKIAAVTLDDLNRVAKQYLHPDRMAIVIVGDRKSIEQPLRTVEGYGANLAFVDAEGRPAPPSGSDPQRQEQSVDKRDHHGSIKFDMNLMRTLMLDLANDDAFYLRP